MKSHLTKDFKDRIESKIADLEKLSSVEYVPVILGQSSTYHEHRINLVCFVVFFMGIILSAHWWPIWLKVVLVVVPGLLSYFIFGWPPLLRFLIGRSLKKREVERAAMSAFLVHEVFATEKRTGVLIFISKFEKSVFVVADKGLLAIVPPAEWSLLGQKLAYDFNHKNPGETFMAALDNVHKKLEKSFPPSENNRDELPNTVHEK